MSQEAERGPQMNLVLVPTSEVKVGTEDPKPLKLSEVVWKAQTPDSPFLKVDSQGVFPEGWDLSRPVNLVVFQEENGFEAEVVDAGVWVADKTLPGVLESLGPAIIHDYEFLHSQAKLGPGLEAQLGFMEAVLIKP